MLLMLTVITATAQNVNKKIPLSPMQFGAKSSPLTLAELNYSKTTNDSIFGKGVWDANKTVDWNSVNAMFRYMEKKNQRYCIMLSPDGYLECRDSLKLPNSMKYDLVWWTLEGAGTKCNFSNTGFYSDVVSLEQATNEATSNSYDMQHFLITGKNKGTAIRLQAPYTNNISFNKISGFDYGIRLLFCLNTIVTANMCWDINIYEVEFGTLEGFVAGANDNNSQSNNGELAHHRSYGNGKMITSLYVKNSSTVVDRQHIGEGGGGNHLIWVDGKYSNFLKSIDIDILHVEQTYKKSVVFIEAKDGKYDVNKIYCQYPNTLIDGKSTGYITINVNKTSYIPANTKFGMSGTTKWEGVAWNFTDNCFSNSVSTIKDSKYWLSDATHFQPVFAPNYQYGDYELRNGVLVKIGLPLYLQPSDHNKGNEWKVWETKSIYN